MITFQLKTDSNSFSSLHYSSASHNTIPPPLSPYIYTPLAVPPLFIHSLSSHSSVLFAFISSYSISHFLSPPSNFPFFRLLPLPISHYKQIKQNTNVDFYSLLSLLLFFSSLSLFSLSSESSLGLGFRENMRLRENVDGGGGGGEKDDVVEELTIAQNQWCPVANARFSSPKRVVIVGYALTSKKIKSFLQPKLEGLARNKGILFVAIDHNRPLSDQGPFDIVLHKLSGKEWRQVLEDYRISNPEVTVLDPPDAIQHLRNRQYMLQAVADMNLSDSYGKVGVPRQLVIKRDASTIPELVNRAGMTLPLVAKPLVADGSPKSHELSLAYEQYSLQKLEPPLVLQEFVNHGGVLFKVYIVGDAIKVVRRFSLPDVSNWELSNDAGLYNFPRVSCAAASADDADLDPNVAELPPRPLLEKLAMELRYRLGLRLFNLDIIREYGKREHFYVIDINYFPGYGKMPEYEHIFTDFLLGLGKGDYKKNSG